MIAIIMITTIHLMLAIVVQRVIVLVTRIITFLVMGGLMHSTTNPNIRCMPFSEYPQKEKHVFHTCRILMSSCSYSMRHEAPNVSRYT